MGKPFKLQGQVGIGRGPDGKFYKIEDDSAKTLADAKSQDRNVQEVAAERAAPMHEVGSEKPTIVDGDAVYDPAIPWPKVETRSPMKLK